MNTSEKSSTSNSKNSKVSKAEEVKALPPKDASKLNPASSA